MCIIVDNNLVQRVLLNSTDAKFIPLRKQLFGSKRPTQRLLYGGRLRDEYMVNGNVRRILLELERAGRTLVLAADLIEREEAIVKATLPCCSNDTHVIALARLSGVRVLVSDDSDLQRDFKNRRILFPRGKCYKNASHAPLLRHGCSL